jgi:hypothetical protein
MIFLDDYPKFRAEAGTHLVSLLRIPATASWQLDFSKDRWSLNEYAPGLPAARDRGVKRGRTSRLNLHPAARGYSMIQCVPEGILEKAARIAKEDFGTLSTVHLVSFEQTRVPPSVAGGSDKIERGAQITAMALDVPTMNVNGLTAAADVSVFLRASSPAS